MTNNNIVNPIIKSLYKLIFDESRGYKILKSIEIIIESGKAFECNNQLPYICPDCKKGAIKGNYCASCGYELTFDDYETVYKITASVMKKYLRSNGFGRFDNNSVYPPNGEIFTILRELEALGLIKIELYASKNSYSISVTKQQTKSIEELFNKITSVLNQTNV